ncbi:MAG TPA: hypothetical protein VFP68_08285 [Burkholderiaceae bacterium]|nr:hypothetical protein [Burkholderiaceae bacterium]
MVERRLLLSTAVAVASVLHGLVLCCIGNRGVGEVESGYRPATHTMRVRVVQQSVAQPVSAKSQSDARLSPDPAPSVRPPSPPPGVATDLPAQKRFLSASDLDRPALPRSAPDTSMLEGVDFSGLPIRLRVFIDEAGRVIEARVLHAQEVDEPALAALQRMLLATRYIPARRGDAEVASFQDIELVPGKTIEQ